MKTLGMIKFFFVAIPLAVFLLVFIELYFKIKAIKRLF
jgi:cell division protein FtsN